MNIERMNKSQLITACTAKGWDAGICSDLLNKELVLCLKTDGAPVGFAARQRKLQARQQPQVALLDDDTQYAATAAEPARESYPDADGTPTGPDLTFVDYQVEEPSRKPSAPSRQAGGEVANPVTEPIAKPKRALSAMAQLMGDMRHLRFGPNNDHRIDAGVGYRELADSAWWDKATNCVGYVATKTGKVNRGLIFVGARTAEVMDELLEEIRVAGYSFDREVSTEHEADVLLVRLTLKDAVAA